MGHSVVITHNGPDALAAAKERPAPALESGWEARVQAVMGQVTPERLSRLDGRQQRKARRLLDELAGLLGD